MNDHHAHWLTLPATIRKLWWGFSVVLALTVLAQLVIYIKGYFAVDGWLGFGAVYGFLSCLAMVLVAKALGFVLKRDEDYYTTADNVGNTNNGIHARNVNNPNNPNGGSKANHQAANANGVPGTRNPGTRNFPGDGDA